jgi:hypothetical protein
MKTPSVLLVALIAAAGVLTGCETSSGARPPVTTTDYETSTNFALMGAHVQHSITATGLETSHTTDGRLAVGANIRNLENRRLEVQVQCVFKDVQGFEVDSTPWKGLILTENSQDTVRFEAMNNKAVNYTIRVREAH